MYIVRTMDIFSSPDVYKPEGPSKIDQPFFEDSRGFIQRVNHGGQKVNLLFTKKGFMRSGDVHKNTQFDFVFNGKIEIWFKNEDGSDTKKIFEKNSFVEIPPGVPHLFNFLEDTFMAEWWDSEFETWYYKPYRQIIENKL